ncbi:EF-P beta-lysylation protein EpmB [Psychrosphaera haliotis]|uniref:L-lysine 2,3-aminomutase n=1 Tax=Psychrosphaera haliotis TaxID=555083 RepID=A0A6N8FCI7_9GAMM|nr:EF-P beta-lysylation protein EpmB [Psychrosphaera haliotis]MUH73259.1 EF-P beta-lysylation protein EpmB [Psychrosphaera haliotis]
MIQQANLSVEPQWQKELKQSFSRLDDLLSFLQISTENIDQHSEARRLFSMRVPKPFAKLMMPGDIDDPLLKQVMPSVQEFETKAGFITDPLDEHNSAQPGLLHKYKSRVLIMFKTGCAVNCRYCFRRHFPYADNSVNKSQLKQHLQYLEDHSEINEVILSGGDPLMAKDDATSWFVSQLELIPNIKRLRIHTRLPVVIPSRITQALCDILKNSRLKTIMVLHINHENEISPELANGLLKLKQANCTLLNQAVLLKNINDNVATQVNLSERLFEVGILPYYLHLFDKVDGASHFNVDEADAKRVYGQMLVELPGFLMPKLVREIGGEASKTPISL